MNKKIIFVILLFIGISFIVYSFANPIASDDDNHLAQTGISENDKDNYYNDDDDLDNSDIVEKEDDDSLKDEKEKKEDDDENEENNVSSSTSSTTNIVTTPTSSNQYRKPSTSIGNNINRVPSSNNGNNTNSSINTGNNGGNTGNSGNNNGGSSNESGNQSGTTIQPSKPNPEPIVPDPKPIKPVVNTIVTSANPNITVKTGNSKNELYLNGQLQTEMYRDANINDVFEVYKISLHFVPSDSSIVGENVTYRFSKTMGLRGELKRASLNSDKSFDVDLIINANLFNPSKSLIVNIDWNDENGETAYTINLNELRTN